MTPNSGGVEVVVSEVNKVNNDDLNKGSSNGQAVVSRVNSQKGEPITDGGHLKVEIESQISSSPTFTTTSFLCETATDENSDNATGNGHTLRNKENNRPPSSSVPDSKSESTDNTKTQPLIITETKSNGVDITQDTIEENVTISSAKRHSHHSEHKYQWYRDRDSVKGRGRRGKGQYSPGEMDARRLR